jgi:tetratricopeptide (TPR) repeat protein/glycosyltransferase involved in cell wall biosynthesis/GT2 family glycosyltransferase
MKCSEKRQGAPEEKPAPCNPVAPPLVSVYCYCRNASKTIGRCIDSILAQDYTNIEVIVQDGESTDGTLDILRSYGGRIDLVSESDNGPGDAMFRCIERASGDVLIACLSDEELLPHAVSWGVKQLMLHPKAGAVYGDHYNIDIEGNLTGIVTPQAWDYAKVLCSEFIPPFCASFFRRTAFEATGLKTYNDCGEFEIWIRLGAMFPVVHVPGLVAKYGVHEEALSFQCEMTEEVARGKINVLETFFETYDPARKYRHLKEEAINSVHTWLVTSYANMGDWDGARDYFDTACSIDQNLERTQGVGIRLLNHGLGLMKAGDITDARKYLELPFKFPPVFQGLDLTPLHQIRQRYMCSVEPATGGSAEHATGSGSDETDFSQIDRLIPPEIQNDAFFEEIKRLAAQKGVEHILEIGSSSGEGSTSAFVSGIKAGGHGARLYCMEISAPRFEHLRQHYRNNEHVQCYRVSSVSESGFPTEKEVSQFYASTPTAMNRYPLEQVLGWLRQDIRYLRQNRFSGSGIRKIKRENGITDFDLVLIDGSEFTGRAEMEEVYGAGVIMLDDINSYKNYDNYHRLKNDSAYELEKEDWTLRNGYAIFVRKTSKVLPVHFFTIVLNGEPFIRYHLEILQKLDIPWHWHIIEGVADLKNDTAWSLGNGGRIADRYHRNGLSVDGTTAYLDRIVRENPHRITLYRNASGAFWDGKLEMVNAPLKNLPQHCLLWQIDADELWSTDQIETAHRLFIEQPARTAAFFHCHFFVGPDLVTTTNNTNSHHTTYEWIRLWRYQKGMQWKSHEPPRLMVRKETGWEDAARIAPFSHRETEAAGLVFTHYAYGLASQVRFKEDYYGYTGAVRQWRRLQTVSDLPVRLSSYFGWVHDTTLVDRVENRIIGKKVPPVLLEDIGRSVPFKLGQGRPHIVIDGVIFQLQAGRAQGISRVWSNLFPELARQLPHARITVLQREGFPVPAPDAEIHTIPPYQLGNAEQLDADDEMLRKVCHDLKADIFISTYYTRAPGLLNVVMIHDLIPELFAFDMSQPEWSAKRRVVATGDAFICVSRTTQKDLSRCYGQTKTVPKVVAPNGLDPCFHPVEKSDAAGILKRLGLTKDYLLLVGNRQGYKGGVELLELLSKSPLKKEFSVLCVGGEMQPCPAELKLGATLDLRYTGPLTDLELAALYSSAHALMVPSRYEGFGLPVIEAMACGCPVIAEKSPAVAEVGEDAVYFVSLSSPDSVFKALQKVAEPAIRKEMTAKGKVRASAFNWSETAGGIGKFFDSLMSRPSILLTAVVSTYNAGKFIKGCLEDLIQQTIAHRMEIIIVDSASQEDEAAVVRDFQSRHPNIKYIRTPIRETVYQAWNRGIKLAAGKYITNANTDDRHRPDAFEQMIGVMEKDETIALVYADVLKTRTPNQTFYQCTPTGMFRWYDWDRKTLLKRGCFIGPQPVWRKKVHKEYGYFDERYKVSSDFEFWLKISQTNDFYHIPEPLGLYLERQDSVEHANHDRKVQEDTQILQRYRDADQKNILISVERKVEQGINGRENPVQDDNGKPDDVTKYRNEKSNQGDNGMDSPTPVLKAIEYLINGGMQEAAYWAMGKLVLDFPDRAHLHNALAVLAYEQEESRTAKDHFEQSVNLAPDNINYLKSYGDFCYVVQKDAEGALALYEKILHIEPDNIEALVMAGHVTISLHRYPEAQNYYQQVLRLNPGNHEVRNILEKLNQSTPEITTAGIPVDELYNAACAKIRDGDPTAAVSLLQQVVAQDDTHGLAHNDLGVLSYETGNMEAALNHYQKAADLMPDNETFQKNLADFYWFEMGDHQRAMERYVKVLELDAHDIEAQLGCGQICLSLGKVADARDFIKVVLEIDPGNEDAHRLYRQIESSLKDANLSVEQTDPSVKVLDKNSRNEHEASIEELMQKLADAPNNAMVHNNLGVLYYEVGEKDKALASYEQAVRLAPHESDYQKNLADFYMFEQGRAEDAMKLYLEVLESNPKDIEALNVIGTICTSLDKMSDARYFFERVLEIEPGNENAASALKNFAEVPEGELLDGKSNLAAG